MVSRQLPNKSHHFDELTHEPAIWSCDTGQWLSSLTAVNWPYCECPIYIKALAKTHLRHPSLPFDSLPYPNHTICRPVHVHMLGQSRDNQMKRGWPYSMGTGLCPKHTSRLWEPRYNSKWWRKLMRRSQRCKKCWDNRNKDKRIITGRPHTVSETD